MTNVHAPDESAKTNDTFEVPELEEIGDAGTVIQGFFGVGWDGPHGMTDPEFEFELDEPRE